MYFLHKKNIPQIPHFDKINIFLCVYWLYSTFHIIILTVHSVVFNNLSVWLFACGGSAYNWVQRNWHCNGIEWCFFVQIWSINITNKAEKYRLRSSLVFGLFRIRGFWERFVISESFLYFFFKKYLRFLYSFSLEIFKANSLDLYVILQKGNAF